MSCVLPQFWLEFSLLITTNKTFWQSQTDMAIKTNLLDTLYLCIRFKHDATIFNMKLERHMKFIFFQKQTEQKKHENIILDTV